MAELEVSQLADAGEYGSVVVAPSSERYEKGRFH